MAIKQCTKCGAEKNLTEFNRNSRSRDGHMPYCRECHRIRANLYTAMNKEQRRISSLRYAEKYPEKKRSASKNYYENNKARVLSRHKKWNERNPERARELQRLAKRRQLAKGQYRLEHNIRSEVRVCLKNGSKRGRRTFVLLGYSINELRDHLERQFQPGMTWENYGPVWHVDHKIPLSAFNYELPEHIDFKRAWALDNLQPMWASDNYRKHAKLHQPFQPSLAI